MLKKITTALLILTCFVSCKWNDQEEAKKPDNTSNAKDVVIGGDKDKDGCLASAGYTWSKLNKECVRVFSGLQLLPIDKTNDEEDDAVFAAYVLFDESADNAELFLPNEDESVLVKRESEGKPWTNGDWELIPHKGYVLKKAGKILYAGDGQIGNKVSGSDDSEDVAP
ncbi:MAG: hypothetical protein V4648_07265 [Bacteroidota bacterium]